MFLSFSPSPDIFLEQSMTHLHKYASRFLILLTSALFAAFPVLAADEKPGLSLEEIVNLKTASQAVISPDGDAVA